MKTIIIVPDKDTLTFKYIEPYECEVYNLYQIPKPKLIIRLLRKIVYFFSFGKSNMFYSDWTKYLDEDVQLIVFDSCKPHYRLQKKLKTAKIKPIIYFWNPITYKDKIRQLKKDFIIYSYSSQDVQKYQLGYNPQFFTEVPVKQPSRIEYDGIFIGKNKSRLKVLETTYRLFNRPFFYVLKDRSETSDVIRLFEKRMPYEEYLQLLCKSQSVIEILYTDNADFSLRTMEALFYQKKLITNNRLIVNAPFFNDNNIFVLNENTTKENIQKFLSIPFVPYCDKVINYYRFEQWLKRFEKDV